MPSRQAATPTSADESLGRATGCPTRTGLRGAGFTAVVDRRSRAFLVTDRRPASTARADRRPTGFADFVVFAVTRPRTALVILAVDRRRRALVVFVADRPGAAVVAFGAARRRAGFVTPGDARRAGRLRFDGML